MSQLLKPAEVRLRSATGDDMGVSGRDLTALAATRTAKSLCSATKLASAGYSTETNPTQSFFALEWRRLHTALTLR